MSACVINRRTLQVSAALRESDYYRCTICDGTSLNGTLRCHLKSLVDPIIYTNHDSKLKMLDDVTHYSTTFQSYFVNLFPLTP